MLFEPLDVANFQEIATATTTALVMVAIDNPLPHCRINLA